MPPSIQVRPPNRTAGEMPGTAPLAETTSATDDPEGDLLEGLVLLAQSLNSGARPLLAHLLAHLLAEPDTELSRAIREAKIDPFGAAHRQRLRRVIGSPPDLEERAALAPALIILTTMTTGRPPDRDEIRNRIMPLQNPTDPDGLSRSCAEQH
jgi:hypothetical protein